jgi:CDP-4-dehydro-6-deoxyglucose reductase
MTLQPDHKIRLANGKMFYSIEGETILNSAVQQEIALEHSCRTGRCSACIARVTTGSTDVLIDEESLTTQELEEGFILTCCRSAISDLELDIEDLGDLAKYKPRTLPARIDSIKYSSDDVMEVVLRTPPASKLAYRAGQYIDVIGPNGVRRSYSLANAPRRDGNLELQIRKVEGGELSKYWFESAKPNDLLRIEGPRGTFCLRPLSMKSLVLLATGTGIAPIKSILEELSRSEAVDTPRFDNIHLYWGGRSQEDLYWRPEFSNLPVIFVPVLSRINNGQARKGYVQHAVLEDRIDLSSAVVYACGSEIMIRSAKSMLVAEGLDFSHFYSDAFVSSS